MENLFKIQAKNLNETDKIGVAIAGAIQNQGGLICLYGDIGSGKTTLVKSIAKSLGVQEKVTSPSFVILNEYHTGKISLYHFDLYRLEKEGIQTILDELREYTEAQKAVAIIEWAEFSSGELPEDRLEIQIKYIEETEREFTFKSFGDRSKNILEKIQQKL
ncbi:MAG: ATP-binding protein [uncultured bacterium]|nr:MAG: ATP-binding protein [uncultured bacterium]HBH17350.1 tRNA (adenosine(37)-N6)-threonylcarbamoyltransferase complex ATPase subunit type 1 TsaE [Cyanobacteria bacterium UBA9579]